MYSLERKDRKKEKEGIEEGKEERRSEGERDGRMEGDRRGEYILSFGMAYQVAFFYIIKLGFANHEKYVYLFGYLL